jgi:hypothetical protein
MPRRRVGWHRVAATDRLRHDVQLLGALALWQAIRRFQRG